MITLRLWAITILCFWLLATHARADDWDDVDEPVSSSAAEQSIKAQQPEARQSDAAPDTAE